MPNLVATGKALWRYRRHLILSQS